MRRATRARHDHRRAGVGAADDAVEAPGLECFRDAHRRQDGVSRRASTVVKNSLYRDRHNFTFLLSA
jgi:hypothetical protein